MKWSLLMLAVLSPAMVTKAADQTAKLQVLQRYGDNNFEGMFCFHLLDAILGWEVVIEFSSNASDIQVNSLNCTSCPRSISLLSPPQADSGGNVVVYVFGINQTSLHTTFLFCSFV